MIGSCKTEQFLKLIDDELGDTPINSIRLGDGDLNTFERLNCSSETLNELLSVLLYKIDSTGLEDIRFRSFPERCEIDPKLMQDIAIKASPKLKEIVLRNMKLSPKAMNAFYVFLQKVFEKRAPLKLLGLGYFSESVYEGKQILNLVTGSGISSLLTLDLGDLPVWFEDNECV